MTHPENEKRAAWATVALDAFAVETFGGRSWQELHPDDRADSFSDLLGDLRHVAAAHGLDFDDLNQRGADHFAHESAPDYQGD